jgi:hypothetical protein
LRAPFACYRNARRCAFLAALLLWSLIAAGTASASGTGAAFCNAYGGVSTSGASIDNVYPCADPDINDEFGYQCVEFSVRFESAVYGEAKVGGPGRDVVSELHSQDVVPIESTGPGNLPEPGDVVSMWGNAEQESVGHTGVVASVNVSGGNGTITFYDENGSLSGGHSVGTDTIYVSNWELSVHWSTPYHYTSFDWTTQAGGPPPPPPKASGDLNGDGKSDIAWYDGGNIVGMLSEANKPLSHWEILAGPAVGDSKLGPPVWAGVGDFTGDGMDDIAWYDGTNIVGLMSEPGKPLSHWEILAGPAVGDSKLGPPVWAGVGDYNGDGKDDIAWYDGTNIVGLMSEPGKPLSHWEYLAGPAVGDSELGPPEWAGSGDFPYTDGGNAMPLRFTADSPVATATVGTPYSYTLASSGTPAPTFSLASGQLPAGLTLNASAGTLSGTPTSAGVFTFTIRATNSMWPGILTPTLTIAVTSATQTSGAPSNGQASSSGLGGGATQTPSSVLLTGK